MITFKKLFPTPVLDTMLDNWEECKAEIKLHLTEQDTFPEEDSSKYTSNAKFMCPQILKKCNVTRNNIEKLIDIYATEIGVKKLTIVDSWINEYHYNEYLPPHGHLPNHVTGTIFIDLPPKGGHFFFSRASNDIDQLFVHGHYNKQNEYNEPGHPIAAKEGQVLIFPSHLYHASTPVLTKGFVRYTLAFNAKVI